MMNKLTRRLSKIPEEVWGEIEPYFLNSSRKLPKLDNSTADYGRKGLTVSELNGDLSILSVVNFMCLKFISFVFD